MLWRFGLQHASNIDKLLEKEDLTLEEVLNDPDLLQEVREQNPKVITYLVLPQNLKQMVDYIATDGFFKFSKMASTSCEVLCSNSIAFVEALIAEYSPHDFDEEDDEDDDGDSDSNSRSDSDSEKGDNANVNTSNKAGAEKQQRENNGGEDDAGSHPPLSSQTSRIAGNNNAQQATSAAPSRQSASPSAADQGPRQYLLEALWGVMSLPAGELDALQATHFSRVMCGLLQRKPYETLDFIRAQESAVPLFLEHIGVSAVVDLLLKVISLEELDDGPGIISWLSEYGLIPMLVDRLAPTCDPETHSLSAQVLLDIIAISQCNNPAQPTIGTNALIDELKSEATVTRLADYMLDREAPHATSTLINCVYIFIELIRRNYSDADAEMSPEEQGGYGFGAYETGSYDQQSQRRLPTVDLSAMMKVLALRVKDLVELLKAPRSSTEPVPTTQGMREPLGFERLRICELFAELLHCSNMPRLNLPTGETGESAVAGESKGLGQGGTAEAHTPASPVTTGMASPGTDKGKSDDGPFKDSPIINSNVSRAGTASAASDGSPKADQHVFSASSSPDAANTAGTGAEAESEAEGGNASSGEEGGYPTIPLEISEPTEHNADNTPVGQLLKWNLIQHEVLPVCTDLFFQFPLNNFLHSVVYDIMHQVLNLPLTLECSVALVVVAFRDVKITSKIAQACAKNDEVCREPKGVRLGYMGHLTGIGEEVARLLELSGAVLEPLIAPYINGDEWLDYVARTLQEVRERDQQPLGGERPGGMDILSGDDSSQVFVSRMGLVDPATGETYDPEEEEDDEDEDYAHDGAAAGGKGGYGRAGYGDEDPASASSSSSHGGKQPGLLRPSELDDDENIDYINTETDIYFSRNHNFGGRSESKQSRQFGLRPAVGDDDEDDEDEDEQYILKENAAGADDGEGIGPAGRIGRFHSYQNERTHQVSDSQLGYSDDDDSYSNFGYANKDDSHSRKASDQPLAAGSRRKVVLDEDEDKGGARGDGAKADDDDDEDDASEMGRMNDYMRNRAADLAESTRLHSLATVAAAESKSTGTTGTTAQLKDEQDDGAAFAPLKKPPPPPSANSASRKARVQLARLSLDGSAPTTPAAVAQLDDAPVPPCLLALPGTPSPTVSKPKTPPPPAEADAAAAAPAAIAATNGTADVHSTIARADAGASTLDSQLPPSSSPSPLASTTAEKPAAAPKNVPASFNPPLTPLPVPMPPPMPTTQPKAKHQKHLQYVPEPKGRVQEISRDHRRRTMSSSELDDVVPSDIAKWAPFNGPTSDVDSPLSSASPSSDSSASPLSETLSTTTSPCPIPDSPSSTRSSPSSAPTTRRQRSRSQSAGVGISRSMVIQAASQGQFPYLDAKTCEFVGQLKSDVVTLGGAAAGNRSGSGSRQRSKTASALAVRSQGLPHSYSGSAPSSASSSPTVNAHIHPRSGSQGQQQMQKQVLRPGSLPLSGLRSFPMEALSDSDGEECSDSGSDDSDVDALDFEEMGSGSTNGTRGGSSSSGGKSVSVSASTANGIIPGVDGIEVDGDVGGTVDAVGQCDVMRQEVAVGRRGRLLRQQHQHYMQSGGSGIKATSGGLLNADDDATFSPLTTPSSTPATAASAKAPSPQATAPLAPASGGRGRGASGGVLDILPDFPAVPLLPSFSPAPPHPQLASPPSGPPAAAAATAATAEAAAPLPSAKPAPGGHLHAMMAPAVDDDESTDWADFSSFSDHIKPGGGFGAFSTGHNNNDDDDDDDDDAFGDWQQAGSASAAGQKSQRQKKPSDESDIEQISEKLQVLK